MHRRAAWPVAIVAIVTVVLGCGGEAASPSPAPTPTAATPACVAVASGVVGLWPASSLDDAPGLDVEGVQLVPGVVGPAWSLDDVAARIAVDGSGDLDIAGDQVTIEAWIRLEANPSEAQTFAGNIGKDAFPDGQPFVLTFESGPIAGVAPGLPANQWQMEYVVTATDGTRRHNQQTGVIVTVDGTFHHYAVTYDGAVVTLYVDGVARYREAFSGKLRSVPEVPVTISGSAPIVIDELGLYATALTEAELGAIVAAGAGGKCGEARD